MASMTDELVLEKNETTTTPVTSGDRWRAALSLGRCLMPSRSALDASNATCERVPTHARFWMQARRDPGAPGHPPSRKGRQKRSSRPIGP